MRLTLNTQEFREKLELVGKASTKHATLPVLQCVMFEAKGGELILRATNLEIGIEAKIKADVIEEGAAAVPAGVLIQTTNLINQKETTLSYKNNSLIIDTGGSATEIKCIPHDEFPTIPRVSGKGQTLNGGLFSLGIRSTAFAASVSSIKPELGSVYVFQKKEHTLTFVATDSFRLMEKTVPQKGVTLEGSILLPHKNAVEIGKICEMSVVDPIYRHNDNQFSLEFESGVYVTSRLTSGSFPDYEQIIPKEYVTHSTTLKQDLLNVFKKTNIFLNKFMQVGIRASKKSVTLSASSSDVGSTTESIIAESEGEELALNFNQRYLSEALPHFIDDSVTLHFSGIGRPMVIKGVSDLSVRYLVMPMNK